MPDPRLGRGLAKILGQEAPTASPHGTLQTIPIDHIGANPDQPRLQMQPDGLHELAASIRQHGLLQPLVVRERPGGARRYQLVAGERRLRAAQEAGLTELPCLVRTLSDADAALAALVENLQREDLNAIDEAEGFQRAHERFGLTQDALAKAVGKSRSHVANTLRLLNLPVGVRNDLRAGRLSAGHARALLGHTDPEQAARAVITRGLNVRQTEALVAASLDRPAPRDTPPGDGRDSNLVALERQLSERLGLAVRVTDRGGHGSLAIRYRTLEQLDGLVTLLGGS